MSAGLRTTARSVESSEWAYSLFSTSSNTALVYEGVPKRNRTHFKFFFMYLNAKKIPFKVLYSPLEVIHLSNLLFHCPKHFSYSSSVMPLSFFSSTNFCRINAFLSCLFLFGLIKRSSREQGLVNRGVGAQGLFDFWSKSGARRGLCEQRSCCGGRTSLPTPLMYFTPETVAQPFQNFHSFFGAKSSIF